jgi:hypothetical protein
MTAKLLVFLSFLILLLLQLSSSAHDQQQKSYNDSDNDSFNILVGDIGKMRNLVWSIYESKTGLEKLKAAITFAISFVPKEQQRVELVSYLWSIRTQQLEGGDWSKDDSYWAATDALAFLGEREAEKELLLAYKKELSQKNSMFRPGSWTGTFHVHMRGGIFYLARVLSYDEEELRSLSWSILNILDPTLKSKYRYNPSSSPKNQMAIIEKLAKDNADLLERKKT